MLKTFSVIDNFWNNTNQLIHELENIKYKRTSQDTVIQISEVSIHKQIVHKKISALSDHKISWSKTNSCTYRKTTNKDLGDKRLSFNVHSDAPYDAVALLYLSPDVNCHGGTGLYKHKETGIEGLHDVENIRRALANKKITIKELSQIFVRDSINPKKWEMMGMISMKFNRLIFFNGLHFHSHIFDFSKVNKKSERLSLICYGELGKKK